MSEICSLACCFLRYKLSNQPAYRIFRTIDPGIMKFCLTNLEAL